MFLSRVLLDLRSRTTLRALAIPERLHAAIEASCSGQAARRLWRLDRRGDALWLLLLSEERPNLSIIANQFAPPDGIAESRDYAPFLGRLANGQTWRFRLTANPVKSVKESEGRGTVRNHVTVEQQERWLLERAHKYGFALEPEGFRVVESRWLIFTKGPAHTRVTIHSVTFEGLLTVTDADRFRETLTQGIGRGKAYGQGLLTLMRAP